MLEIVLSVIVVTLWIPTLLLLRRMRSLEQRLVVTFSSGLTAAHISLAHVAPVVESLPETEFKMGALDHLRSGGSLDLAPGMEMRLASPSHDTGTSLALSRSSLRRLSETTAQLLPELGQLTGPAKFQMIFSAKTMQGLRDNTLEFVPRDGGFQGGFQATARSVAGRKSFVENGVLQKASMAPVAAAMAWKVMAEVTQQKFLCDINDKLTDISSKLEVVIQWLKDEELAVLWGSFRHLKSWEAALREGELDPMDLQCLLQQIEEVNRDCFKIQTAAVLRLQRGLDKLEALHSEKLTVDSALDQTRVIVDNTRQDIHVSLLASRIRALGNSLRGSLPGSRSLVQVRAAELTWELKIIRDASEGVIAALQEPRSIESFSNQFWNRGAGAQSRYETEVANLIPRIDGEYHALITGADAEVAQLQGNLAEVCQLYEQPMTVELACGPQGEVLEVVHVRQRPGPLAGVCS